MMRRDWKHAINVLGAALLVALASGLLLAKGSEEDDRPPIIVRDGSLIFEGGEIVKNEKGETVTNTHSWSKDAFLDEWKPSQHAKGVSALEVTFVPVPASAPCAVPLRGEDVSIEYRLDETGDPLARMRVHLRRKYWLFKREPKIDPNGKELVLQEHTSLTPMPPRLVYEDHAPGWISKVTVDGTACAFAKPPNDEARLAFRVRIQPKRH